MNNINQFAFVVLLRSGEYEDKQTKAIRVFQGPEAEWMAKDFAEWETKRISRMQGRVAARNVLIDEWKDRNPKIGEDQEWYKKRELEFDRISTLLGIDTSYGIPCCCDETFTVIVEKVPFGFPKSV